MTGPRGEAARKSIHVLLSLAVAALVWWLPATTAAVLLAAASGAALAVEAARRSSRRAEHVFTLLFGPLLRPAESRRITGATTLALGYLFAVALLPGRPALAGILFAGVADAVAAVIGRRWGRHRYRGGKSVEGSAAFLVVAAGLGWALGLTPLQALLAAGAMTLIEAPSLRHLDDNLYLPIAGAAVFRAVLGV